MRQQHIARSIGTFLVLTVGVTWLLWMPVLRIAGAVHEPPRIPPLLALGGPVFLLGVFAPGFVALVLTGWEGGGSAVGGLLRRMTPRRPGDASARARGGRRSRACRRESL